MRVRLLSLLVSLSALTIVPAAFADTLDFTFSFTGPNQAAGGFGTVTGEIVGLSDNGTSSATAIYIDTADNNTYHDTLPYDVLSSYAGVYDNSFTVMNGVITAAQVYVSTTYNDPTEPQFNYFQLNISSQNLLGFGNGAISNDNGLAGTTYTLVPGTAVAPEPASMTFLLEGLAAGACLGWRRLRRTR